MDETPGFDKVFDRGAHVLDVGVNGGVHVNDGGRKSENSGITCPVARTEQWERASSQAQRDCKEVYGESQNTVEQVKVKVPPKTYEPTKEERQSHEATHRPFRVWCEICVKAESPDGRHTKQLVDTEHILVIEFDYAFATDTPGDPNRITSMMVATGSIHGSVFAVVARRRGGQDDYVMQSFQNYRVFRLSRTLSGRGGPKNFIY